MAPLVLGYMQRYAEQFQRLITTGILMAGIHTKHKTSWRNVRCWNNKRNARMGKIGAGAGLRCGDMADEVLCSYHNIWTLGDTNHHCSP